MRRARSIAVVTALATALLGCSSDAEDVDASTTPAGDEAGAVGNGEGRTIALDSGVQLHVAPVEVDGDLVRVPLQAWNGTADDVEVAASEPELTDNADNRYEYRPPDANQPLRVESGDVIRGTLVFELIDDGWDEDEPPQVGSRFHLHLNRYTSAQPQAEITDLAPAG
jgi:hypothetical protein